jgi:hypothetical protein
LKKVLETTAELGIVTAVGFMFVGYSLTVYPYEKWKNKQYSSRPYSRVGSPIED